VSLYQKGKTNLDFTEARDSEWQWNLLGHMQVCTLLEIDNHASTPLVNFLQAGCPSYRPTNSVKALKVEGDRKGGGANSRQIQDESNEALNGGAVFAGAFQNAVALSSLAADLQKKSERVDVVVAAGLGAKSIRNGEIGQQQQQQRDAGGARTDHAEPRVTVDQLKQRTDGLCRVTSSSGPNESTDGLKVI